MTPHINAKKDDIANLVIMPGDPKRATFIAKHYLENYKLVNEVRGMLAYTGFYKNKKVTVMASGMGMPSMAIYAHELFNFYDVDKIIRVGSCKSLTKDIDINELILAEQAYTLSNFAYSNSGQSKNILKASDDLTSKIKETAKRLDLLIYKGTINTSDVFYSDYEDKNTIKYNCLGVEMETFALFYEALKAKKEAASLLTVSDNVDRSKVLTPTEREKSFSQAIFLALESIIY